MFCAFSPTPAESEANAPVFLVSTHTHRSTHFAYVEAQNLCDDNSRKLPSTSTTHSDEEGGVEIGERNIFQLWWTCKKLDKLAWLRCSTQFQHPNNNILPDSITEPINSRFEEKLSSGPSGDHKTNQLRQNYLLIFPSSSVHPSDNFRTNGEDTNLINIQWGWKPRNCFVFPPLGITINRKNEHTQCGETHARKINFNNWINIAFIPPPWRHKPSPTPERGHYQHSHCDNKFKLNVDALECSEMWKNHFKPQKCLLHTSESISHVVGWCTRRERKIAAEKSRTQARQKRT